MGRQGGKEAFYLVPGGGGAEGNMAALPMPGGRRRRARAAAALRLAPPPPARRVRLLLGCPEVRGGRSGGERQQWRPGRRELGASVSQRG